MPPADEAAKSGASPALSRNCGFPAVTVLTEENLSRYYRARVKVIRDGPTLIVVPVRGQPDRADPVLAPTALAPTAPAPLW